MNQNSVTENKIDALIELSIKQTMTVFGKVTVVCAKLPNGFVITESSGCVDPANYDEKIGYKICLERIKNKLWELEGYSLSDRLQV